MYSRNKYLTLLLLITSSYCIYRTFRETLVKRTDRSLPLILLYTFNRSVKTRDHICRGLRNGGHPVSFAHCPFQCEFSCRIEDFTRRSPSALLFFGEDFYWPWQITDRHRTSFQQRWIFWSWEAPISHPEYLKSGLTFNWTMTYRQDSDIVHDYGRYIARHRSATIRDHQAVDFYLSSSNNQSTFDVEKEFQVRENRILWFVSNCRTRSKRHQTADQLNTLFPIDQYGQCSSTNKKLGRISEQDFERLLFKYKFYLAFENAQCEDYITEKLFYNALAHGSIPIVLGASASNCARLLPPKSFIHVESFKDLQALSQELTAVSRTLKTFQSYHHWRVDYRLIVWPSNYYIDDRFCDLCTKLHLDQQEKSYTNFSNWLNRCK